MIVTRDKFSSKNWNEGKIVQTWICWASKWCENFGVTTNYKLNLYPISIDMINNWLTDPVSSFDKLLVKSCELKMEKSIIRALYIKIGKYLNELNSSYKRK